MLSHTNGASTSRGMQRIGGSSLYDSASIARSPQMTGIHIRLIKVCSLMHLRTPRPLASVATRSWPSMLVARRMPKMMLVMQNAERGFWWVDMSSSNRIPDSDIIWTVPEGTALFSIWTSQIPPPILMRCIPLKSSPKTGEGKAF